MQRRPKLLLRAVDTAGQQGALAFKLRPQRRLPGYGAIKTGRNRRAIAFEYLRSVHGRVPYPRSQGSQGAAGRIKVVPKAASKQGSNFLAHPPEERQRPLGYAGEIFGPGIVAKIPAERRAHHLVQRRFVQPPGGGLFVLKLFAPNQAAISASTCGLFAQPSIAAVPAAWMKGLVG